MTDVFTTAQTPWSYSAVPSMFLYNTTLPIPTKSTDLAVPRPTHDAGYWAAVTKGFDFKSEDRVDGKAYNHVLWKGLMGAQPYPEIPSLQDLRFNRERLLAAYRAAQKAAEAGEPGNRPSASASSTSQSATP